MRISLAVLLSLASSSAVNAEVMRRDGGDDGPFYMLIIRASSGVSSALEPLIMASGEPLKDRSMTDTHRLCAISLPSRQRNWPHRTKFWIEKDTDLSRLKFKYFDDLTDSKLYTGYAKFLESEPTSETKLMEPKAIVFRLGSEPDRRTQSQFSSPKFQIDGNNKLSVVPDLITTDLIISELALSSRFYSCPTKLVSGRTCNAVYHVTEGLSSVPSDKKCHEVNILMQRI